MKSIKLCILEKMFKKGGFRKRIAQRMVISREGEMFSKTLRRIYRDVYGLEIGAGSYGCFSERFRSQKGVIRKVGKYCSFANDVDILIGNHPLEDVSTSPLFHLRQFGIVNRDSYSYKTIIIGNDVWIGCKATITGGCSLIGDGAVIAANAVVTHDVEPYAIVAGVPAKVIGYRFDKKTIESLLASRWWDYPQDLLNPLLCKYHSDVQKFLAELGNLKTQKNSLGETDKINLE